MWGQGEYFRKHGLELTFHAPTRDAVRAFPGCGGTVNYFCKHGFEFTRRTPTCGHFYLNYISFATARHFLRILY